MAFRRVSSLVVLFETLREKLRTLGSDIRRMSRSIITTSMLWTPLPGVSADKNGFLASPGAASQGRLAQ